MSRSVHPQMLDIMRRFQPTGDAETNRALSCDPAGYARVSEEVQESVGYPRPAFNWPSSSSPHSNYFSLEGMATDTLREAGFERERKSLMSRLTNAHPAYAELPSLLFLYVDFQPAQSFPPEKVRELQELAESMGLDPESVGRAKKKRVANPLAHPKSAKLGDEWRWLVQNADVVSPFGKTAACEMGDGFKARLAELWLPELARSPTGDPADPSVGNRAWFEAKFPMGWMHLDRLHETAVVSSGRDFETFLTLAYYEIANKSSRGWEPDEARRFAFHHKNAAGVTGSALLGNLACDHFVARLAPEAHKPAPPTSALARHLASENPSLSLPSDAMWLWAAYRLVDPDSCALVEAELFKAPTAKHPHAMATLRAQLEKASLSMGLAAWPPTQLDAAPLPPPPGDAEPRRGLRI